MAGYRERSGFEKKIAGESEDADFSVNLPPNRGNLGGGAVFTPDTGLEDTERFLIQLYAGITGINGLNIYFPDC